MAISVQSRRARNFRLGVLGCSPILAFEFGLCFSSCLRTTSRENLFFLKTFSSVFFFAFPSFQHSSVSSVFLRVLCGEVLFLILLLTFSVSPCLRGGFSALLNLRGAS